MRAELFSSSFARSTTKLTFSNFTLTQKSKTAFLGLFDVTSHGSRVSLQISSDFGSILSRYAMSPRNAPYIDGQNRAWSDDRLT